MSTTSFSSRLKAKKTEIDSAIDRFFAESDTSMYSPHGQEAWDILMEFSSRPGKRIRGTLLLVAFEMYGGKRREEAMKAAVAIELIQNYLLIVDDVMDRSTIRRTKPTVQYIYRDILESFKSNDARHIGDMLAVNVGLLASHAAARLMNEIDVGADSLIAANQKFHHNILQTCFGQIDDLYLGVAKVDEGDVIRTHELKSSYYTFINPMQIGALLADADIEEVDLLREFGLPAGVAFQLQDDILGLFGTGSTGKSNTDDLKEGKVTLMIQYALKHAKGTDLAIMKQALGNQNVSDAQAQEVRRIVEECGAKDYATKQARKFASDAGEVIDKSSWTDDYKAFLSELMQFITERLS